MVITSSPVSGQVYFVEDIRNFNLVKTGSETTADFKLSYAGNVIYHHVFTFVNNAIDIRNYSEMIGTSITVPNTPHTFQWEINVAGSSPQTGEFTAKIHATLTEIQYPLSGLGAEFGDIIIESNCKSVAVEISNNGDNVFSEIYTPDPEGKIYISEIGKVAMQLIQPGSFDLTNGIEGSPVVLSITITADEIVNTKEVTIYQSVVDFAGSLDVDLLKLIPLCRMTKKITGPGRTEFVSFYGTGTVSAYVVKKGITQDVAATYTVGPMDTADKMYRMNVSPDVIATLAGCTVPDLIYYNVYKNTDCIIRFTMDQRNYPVKRTFIFRNCFGAQESFTCIGDEESSRKWTREYGVRNNAQMQISRDQVNSIKVNTGPISLQSIEAIEDLLEADPLALLDEYGFQPIVILEENFSSNSRRDELKSVDFTYRFASNNQRRTTYAAFKKPRIFDPTFDDTFN